MSYKKLIIVGNASTLLDQKNGHKIDEFDYVIRTGSYQIKNYEQYTGTKTDLYCTLINYFFNAIKNNDKLTFRPPLINFNFKDILFLEINPFEYSETSPIGSDWGVGHIPVPKAAAGEIYLDKIYRNPLYKKLLTNKNNDVMLYEYLLEQFKHHYKNFNISYYSKEDKIAFFKEFNSLSLLKNMSVPSKGMYMIYYAIKHLCDYKIYVTGFNGLQTKNYWQPKNYEKEFQAHCSYKEKYMYKKLLSQGLIHEL